jgi:hypothetical protein
MFNVNEYVSHIITENTIIFNFKDRSVPIATSHRNHYEMTRRLAQGDIAGAISLLDIASSIRAGTRGRITIVNGLTYIDGVEMPPVLSKRLFEIVQAGSSPEVMLNFWDRLKNNPSEESKKDLYAFLEHNGHPIMKDGRFLAYKRVNENFKDIHTNTLDNSVGKIIDIGRDAVDPNRNNTCSRGLHVASFKYAHDFYGNGHLLEIAVDPADVVTVPPDYNQEKMRVSRYEVLQVCGGPRENEVVYNDGIEDEGVEDWYDNFETSDYSNDTRSTFNEGYDAGIDDGCSDFDNEEPFVIEADYEASDDWNRGYAIGYTEGYYNAKDNEENDDFDDDDDDLDDDLDSDDSDDDDSDDEGMNANDLKQSKYTSGYSAGYPKGLEHNQKGFVPNSDGWLFLDWNPVYVDGYVNGYADGYNKNRYFDVVRPRVQ